MEQNKTKLSAARIMQFCGSQLIELSDHPEVCHSGMQMAELYIKWASQFGPIRPVNSNISDDILHWVTAAWIDREGEFHFTLADYIQNC